MRLYCETFRPQGVIASGLKDEDDWYGESQSRRGVWLTERPVAREHGVAVEVPIEALIEHEIPMDDGFRRFVVPAAQLASFRPFAPV